jgi:hypothetical protein
MGTLHADHYPYYQFTGKSRLDKSINTLLGIVEGITIDSKIDDIELDYLIAWLNENNEFRDRHPYNELFPVLTQALEDGVITDDERSDILWLCERLRSNEFYGSTTTDLQRLHAVLGGITADGLITEAELQGLSSWLLDHENLRTCWPYDEVDSLITKVLADKVIDQQEQSQLMSFFSEFIESGQKHTIIQPQAEGEMTLSGVCAVSPEIIVPGSTFCFTGASKRYNREQFKTVIVQNGGRFTNSISKNLNYLVIGGEGNPCWAYACYGRKVEAAVSLRKQGHRLLLVHEYDFTDALMDL